MKHAQTILLTEAHDSLLLFVSAYGKYHENDDGNQMLLDSSGNEVQLSEIFSTLFTGKCGRVMLYKPKIFFLGIHPVPVDMSLVEISTVGHDQNPNLLKCNEKANINTTKRNYRIICTNFGITGYSPWMKSKDAYGSEKASYFFRAVTRSFMIARSNKTNLDYIINNTSYRIKQLSGEFERIPIVDINFMDFVVDFAIGDNNIRNVRTPTMHMSLRWNDASVLPSIKSEQFADSLVASLPKNDRDVNPCNTNLTMNVSDNQGRIVYVDYDDNGQSNSHYIEDMSQNLNMSDQNMADTIIDINKSIIGRWVVDDAIIGKGAFSLVCKGVDRQHTSTTVATKIMFKTEERLQETEWAARNEITCLTKISHNNVIKLLAYNMNAKYKNETAILLVLEYAARGELTDLLSKLGKFDEILARTYFRQIISGIEACHKVGIVHRDIKVQNILLDWSYNIKICDFGLSKLTTNKDLSIKSHVVGTPGFTAPEVLKKQDYNSLCDIFSAGIVLFVMLTKRRPFRHVVINNKGNGYVFGQRYQEFIHENSKYWKKMDDIQAGVSPAAEQLLNSLLHDDPSTTQEPIFQNVEH